MTAPGPGLETVRHVFLEGCGLPAAWSGQRQWRILATAFGHGMAFLATWHAWRTDPQRAALLHFAAIEPAPVRVEDLLGAVRGYPALQPLAEALASQWRGLVPGVHRLSFEDGHVLLTLCVGELLPMLRQQALRADAVFAASPQEDPETLKAVTRLCRRGATLAADALSVTAHRILRSAGWQLAPRQGLTAASQVLAGRFDPGWPVASLESDRDIQPGECVVIGAGLAGAAVAASLARRGWQVRVLDAADRPAAGASALPVGLLAPHQSPDDNLLSRLSRAGVRMALEEAQQRLAAGLEWGRTGTLEWRGDDRRPLPSLGDALAPWSRPATPAQKQAAGIDASHAAWWHELAAWIEPAALVRAWLRRPGVRFEGGRQVSVLAAHGHRWRVQDTQGDVLAEADLVVVAAALGSNALLGNRLPLHAVGGQVSWAPHAEDAESLPPFPVNGHGHFLPRVPLVERGAWITGSTYRRGDADPSVRSEDTGANLRRVQEVLPRAAATMQQAIEHETVRSWSGVRCASADRRPLLGAIAPGLWVSTAMGSRGLTFSLLCAELLAARLHGEPLPVEARLAQALDTARQLAAPRSG